MSQEENIEFLIDYSRLLVKYGYVIIDDKIDISTKYAIDQNELIEGKH
ncbi:hypothetical protein [Bacillus sp. OAE603]